VRVLLTRGDVAGAFAAGARLRAVRAKSKRVTELDSALEAVAKPKKVKASPVDTGTLPAQLVLPIAFDAGGALFAKGKDGMLRVDPATLAVTPAADAPAWNTAAELLGDLRVAGASDGCHGDFLRILVRGATLSRDLPVPFVGTLAPFCTSSRPPSLSLLHRDADGLTVLLEGEPFTVSADGESATPAAWPSTPGGAGTIRSPDGRFSVIAGGDRVLVRGPERSEVWRPEPHFALTACAVANEARAIACVLEHGGIVVLTP
jgi:hypothetical protein